MSVQLGLDGMPAALVRVTPSRLAAWEGCRRRYRMTYLDRPAPSRGGAWAHSTLGATVHNALRALVALPAPDRTPERAAALVDRHWSDEGFRDAEQAARYRERARGWVADYAAECLGQGEHADREAGALGLERWVSAPVGGIVAEGRVDRIDARGDDAVVVDYKTGRGALDPAGSRALALYCLATARMLRRRCRRVELHHVPTGEVASAEHDDASLARHRAAAEDSAAELSAAAEELRSRGAGGRAPEGRGRDADADALFPPSPGPGCARCEVRRHCPEGRAAAPAADPWALLAP